MHECVYLNNGATSYPKPNRMLDEVAEVLRRPPSHHARAGFESESLDLVFACRQQLATLFHAPIPNRITFSSGSTESLNLALYGLALDGKHVVTTAIEHNSVLRPLKTMERQGRITLSIAACDKNGFVSAENIQKEITPQTAAVVVNHCSNVTGMVSDVEAIGAITKEQSITFIVDASQSAGVYPIDVQKMNIDVLAFTGHKSLYGMQGIGGAYIRDGLNVEPLKVGGTGVRSDYLFQPETVPMYYEAGTQNLPGIVSLYEGVNHIMETGLDQIRHRKEELVDRMMQHLLESGHAVTFPDRSCGQRSTIFCFNVNGIDPADVGYILENQFGIVVRSGLHCAPLIHQHIGTFPDGSVRVSPSHFTTDEEIEFFNRAMDQIVEMAG